MKGTIAIIAKQNKTKISARLTHRWGKPGMLKPLGLNTNIEMERARYQGHDRQY